MKHLTNDPRPRYFSSYQRMAAALISAYYIIIEGQPGPFYRTVQSYDFLITLVFSFVIAMILVELVHWFTWLLDRFVPWKRYVWWRLVLQLLFGVWLVVQIDILLVKFFFRLFNYDFEASRYMVSEFPLVKWMIYLLNIYYWTCHYAPGLFDFRRLFRKRKTEAVEELPIVTQEPGEVIEMGPILVLKLGPKVKHVSPSQVACFKKESATGFAYLKDGSRWNFDYKTGELLELLPRSDFFQTNRGIIYSFDVIEAHRREKKEGLLLLKEGVDLGEVSRIVSRDRYAEFRERFSALRN